MRIAVFVRSFPTPTESFVVEEIVALLRLGCEVDIFAEFAQRAGPVAGLVTRYALRDRTHYRQRTDDIRLPSRVMPVRRLSTAQLSHVLLVGRYDAVRAHFGPAGIAAVHALTASGIHVPVLVAFHGFDASGYFLSEGRELYAELLHRSALFLPVCRALASNLTDAGYPPERVLVHGVGIDTDYFSPPRRTVARRGSIVSVGRLVEKKGFDDGIRALAHVVAAGVDATYTIIGTGPLESDLRAVAVSLGVAKRVHFVGEGSRAVVRRTLRAASVVLVPSRLATNGDQEGVPVVAMEAMACGAAVVATNHSGLPELIAHDESGLLVPSGDPAALGDAVRCLLSDSTLRTRLTTNARQTVVAQRDVLTLAKQLLRLAEAEHARLGFVPTPAPPPPPLPFL